MTMSRTTNSDINWYNSTIILVVATRPVLIRRRLRRLAIITATVVASLRAIVIR